MSGNLRKAVVSVVVMAIVTSAGGVAAFAARPDVSHMKYIKGPVAMVQVDNSAMSGGGFKACPLIMPAVPDSSGKPTSITNNDRFKQPVHQDANCHWFDGDNSPINVGSMR